MKLNWQQLLWESIKGFPMGILFGVVFTFSILGLFLSSLALNSMVMQTDIQKEIASADGLAEALGMMYSMLTNITGFILGLGVLGSMIRPIWYYMAKVLLGRVALQNKLVFTQKEGSQTT